MRQPRARAALRPFSLLAVCAAILLALSPARAAETPLAGCYERSYDARHLAAHRGQIVVRVRLKVERWTEQPPFLANAPIELWVRGRKQSFQSKGACKAEGEGLICNGSSSAEETDRCRTKADGVRNCRIADADSGRYHIAARPEGVLVTIRERLELMETPDGGRYLYLSPDSVENRAFLLTAAPAGACK